MANKQKIVQIITRSIEDPDIVTKRTFDYSNMHSQEWLKKHMWWALNSNMSVLLVAYEGEKAEEKYEDHDILDFDEQNNQEEIEDQD